MSLDQTPEKPVKVVVHCCGCPLAQTAQEPEPPLPGVIVVNLALLIGFGVAVSGWVLYYTDWFPVVGSLLGLGGLFVWIAFVSGLLTDARKEQFQKAFERRVLLRHRVWMGVLALAAAFALFATLHGSLVLHSLADNEGRNVVIRTPEQADEPVHELFMPPREARKRLVFTGWGGRSYEVKAAGLPAARLEVFSFDRTVVSSPSSFIARPVLLIHPEPRISANAQQFDFKLVVWRGGNEIGKIESGKYRGEAVWIGCDEDVQVPEAVTARWHLELLRNRISPEVMARWTTPVALAAGVSLKARDPVRAALFQGEKLYAEGKEWIAPSLPGRGFVHVLQIKLVPEDNRSPEVTADAEPPQS